MGKLVFHPVGARLRELQAQVAALEARTDAQSFVLGWLLAQMQGNAASSFLAVQAEELDQPGARQKHLALIELLDELREEVALWHAQQRAPRNPPAG